MGFTDCGCWSKESERVCVWGGGGGGGGGGGRLVVCAQGDWSEVVWVGYMWFGVVYIGFGDKMAG